MSDYIDRQEALEALRGITIISASSLDGVRKYADEMLAKIEAIPSADVEPVRHGRWEVFYAEELCGYRRAYYVCSNRFGSSDDEFDYCPNCGARMDGDADA